MWNTSESKRIFFSRTDYERRDSVGRKTVWRFTIFIFSSRSVASDYARWFQDRVLRLFAKFRELSFHSDKISSQSSYAVSYADVNHESEKMLYKIQLN